MRVVFIPYVCFVELLSFFCRTSCIVYVVEVIQCMLHQGEARGRAGGSGLRDAYEDTETSSPGQDRRLVLQKVACLTSDTLSSIIAVHTGTMCVAVKGRRDELRHTHTHTHTQSTYLLASELRLLLLELVEELLDVGLLRLR